MNCPNCNTLLTLAERQGIEIDFCPQCRGVWLDRGELDKMIERSTPTDHRAVREPGRDDNRFGGDMPTKRKKREGFLGDLFDF